MRVSLSSLPAADIVRRRTLSPLETASFRLPKTVREWLAWRAERNGISRTPLVTLTLERAMRYDREWKSSRGD